MGDKTQSQLCWKRVLTPTARRRQPSKGRECFCPSLLSRGSPELPSCLSRGGAEVNKVDVARNVPLLYAAQNQHLEIVELLIQHRAVLGATNETGASALTLAAQAGNVPIMSALLAAGADPHHLDAGGLSVLSSAAVSCSVEAVRLLLARNASVNLQCRTSGDFPLRCAAASGKSAMPILGVVIPGTRVDDTAAAETVRELLQAGALVNMARHDGATALLFSSQSGNALVAQLLMDAGADANQPSKKGGCTPLCSAAEHGSVAVVSVLLQRADVNKTTQDGRSPLYLAAAAGHVDVCKVLLAHSADPNLASDTGSTALMMASQNARVEAVRLLIEAGANVNHKAHNTGTALMSSLVGVKGRETFGLVPAMSREREQAALTEIGIMLLKAGAERLPLR